MLVTHHPPARTPSKVPLACNDIHKVLKYISKIDFSVTRPECYDWIVT